MSDYFMGARQLGQEEAGSLQQTQAAPAAVDYFSGARQLDRTTAEPAMASPERDVGRLSMFAPGLNFKPRQPSITDTAADVAKSGGIGLVQGAIGLATLPGNIEMLGRMGVDKAAEFIGLESPNTVADQKLPHYGDAKKFIEGYTGEFYQPQTTAGKYARTIGEFAPMAIGGPVGLAGKAARVAVPAVASEAAGQATEGTAAEPWARAGAAIAGSFAPSVATRAVSPSPVPNPRLKSVRTLEREGVTSLTAGQKTDSTPLRWMEASSQDIPFAGKRAKVLQEQQADQFTRATLKRAGIDADRATPEVLNDAFVKLGTQFDDMASRSFLNADTQFAQSISKALRDYELLTPPPSQAPLVKKFADEFGKLIQQQRANPSQPIMTGQVYQKWRHDLDEYARAAQKADPGSQLPTTLYALRNAMDDAVERGLPKSAKAEFAKTRRQYKNLLTIEKAASGAGPNAVEGVISPAALRTATKTGNLRDYTRGRDDLSELARAGVSVMTPLPQSGTAPRAMAMNMLNLGLGAGGATMFGPMGLALAAAPQVTARTLMSAPVQRYLGNQLAAPAYNALAAGRPSIAQHSYLLGPMAFEDR